MIPCQRSCQNAQLTKVLTKTAAYLEVTLRAIDGVAGLFPVLDLGDFAVAGRVVRRRMVSLTVRHGFDQHRGFLAQNKLSCCASRDVNRQEVVPVDADHRDAVSSPSRRDTIASELVDDRGTDRKAVVPAEEQDGTLFRRREVQGSVEISFTCSPFSEIANADAVLVRKLKSVSRSDSLVICHHPEFNRAHITTVDNNAYLRQLCSQRRRDCLMIQILGAVVDRHLTTLPVAILVAKALWIFAVDKWGQR